VQTQTLFDEINRFRSHKLGGGEAEGSQLNHIIELSAVGCHKGVGPKYELVGKDTQTPDVTLATITLLPKDLWGHVVWSTSEVKELRFTLVANPGESKIYQLQLDVPHVPFVQ
jgi:hypothetical protein